MKKLNVENCITYNEFIISNPQFFIKFIEDYLSLASNNFCYKEDNNKPSSNFYGLYVGTMVAAINGEDWFKVRQKHQYFSNIKNVSEANYYKKALKLKNGKFNDGAIDFIFKYDAILYKMLWAKKYGSNNCDDVLKDFLNINFDEETLKALNEYIAFVVKHKDEVDKINAILNDMKIHEIKQFDLFEDVEAKLDNTVEKHKFKVNTDDALIYLYFLRDNKDMMNLLLSFFEEVMDFRELNNSYSDYNFNFNRYVAGNFRAPEMKICKKYPHIPAFISKYEPLFEYFSDNCLYHYSTPTNALAQILDGKQNGVSGYSKDDVNNVTCFLKYVKENFDDLEKMIKAVERISEANIRFVEMNGDKFNGYGKATIDFQHKKNPQSAYSTLLPFTNGIRTEPVEKEDNVAPEKKGNVFEYGYRNADFLINLEIDPVFKRRFDLNKQEGYYKEKFCGTIFTAGARKANDIFDSVERTIYVRNLAFDPETLPELFTLDSTLYTVFPAIKEKIICNQNAEVGFEKSSHVKLVKKDHKNS